jgi:hypothetical protein
MADGIPYPQAPSYATPNPLQQMEQMQALGLRGAEMARVQQATEQQGLVNRAQQGLGQLMQQHVNPETGDVDINKLLVDAAQHPDVSVLYPNLVKDALSMRLTNAQVLGAQIDNAAKQQSFLANTAASYADKYAKTGAKANWQDIASIYAEAQAAGVIDRKQALQGLIFAKQSGQQPETLIRNLGARSAQGLQALEAAGQTTKYLQELIDVQSPEGVPGKITREQALQQAGAAPSPYAAGGASAPRSAEAARQGESPSAPPAAPMIRTGLSPTEQAETAPYRQYQEGAGPMREFEQMINQKAENAQMVNMRLEETAKKLQEFKTGPGTKARFEVAKIAQMFGRDDLANSILGNPGSKEALAAAQEVEKLTTRNAFEELKTALGGQGRFTNLEVENFMRSNFNLETMPEAIQDMINFTKKITDLADQQQTAFSHYKKRSFANKRDPDSFNPGYFSQQFMNHLHQTGQIRNGQYVIKQPGEK